MAISRMNMERQLRAGGGIMGLEEPRQGYFLGKIVKKAARAVKKVVKSPIGKAAITGALMFGVPGTQIGGLLGRASFGGAAPSIFGKTGGIGALLGTGGKFETLGNLFRVGGEAGAKFSIPRILGGVGAAGLIASPFLMGGDEEEEEPDIPFTQTPDSIASIVNMARNQDPSLRFLPKPKFVDNFYAADGGRAGYDGGGKVCFPADSPAVKDLMGSMQPRAFVSNGGPIELASNMENDRTLENLFQKYLDMGMSEIEAEKAARDEFDRMSEGIKTLNKRRATAAEGGLMDLGGFEKDYREGGFVPLGAEERADDVPARLSKNEFVFTADAVRNAGGGDIDKGAEVMQNMMDNLEAGGNISEESQGMENPAQEMFDQAQMLESRIA